MSHEIQLNAAGPMCVEAVRTFAAAIAKATPLRPIVTTVEDAADVVFLDGSPPETTLHVEWACRLPVCPDFANLSEWENNDQPIGEADTEDLPEHTVRYYIRTMTALARNVEAASVFLQARKTY